jgi:hypothetical protein
MASEKNADAADADTKRQLCASLYGALRKLAERQLRRNAGASTSPATLLHEAYLGMHGRDAAFPDRERFVGYAARGASLSWQSQRAITRPASTSATC